MVPRLGLTLAGGAHPGAWFQDQAGELETRNRKKDSANRLPNVRNIMENSCQYTHCGQTSGLLRCTILYLVLMQCTIASAR